MKKLVFIVAVLILITVASVAAWQIYVPVHEENVSIQAYEDLRQFVELPAPEPTPCPSINNPIPPSISPTQSPNSDSTVTSVPQVDFESLQAVNPEIVAWLTRDGTNINYPVTKHSDNDYYLHHLFNG